MATRLSLEQVPSSGVDRLDGVYAAAFSPDRFSPDGAQLATAGTDATARVWDLPAASD